ncbi:MAG TPA: hypothetical protein VHO91_21445 [Rhodopila sp.]|nr:hypothetical protein [Rhodopila sp.]
MRRHGGRFQLLTRLGLLILAAAASGPTLLGQTAQSPIHLSAEPTVIPLPLSIDVARSGGLSDYVRSLSGDEKLVLVIEGLHTDRPPDGVYQVYLRSAGMTTAKGIYAGSISFFGSVPAGDRGAERSISLDVTAPIRSATGEIRIGAAAEVMIRPQGNMAQDAHPSVQRIALFSQRS